MAFRDKVLGPRQGISKSSPATVQIIIVIIIISSNNGKDYPCLEPLPAFYTFPFPLWPTQPVSCPSSESVDI